MLDIAKNAMRTAVREYFLSNMDNLIRRVKHAILEGIRFDYLLIDNWFTYKEQVEFVRYRHIGCHFLGMIKMSKPSMTRPIGP